MKEGSTGLPFPDNEVKIVAIGTQDEVPVGEDGEICVTGPTQMKGYYNNEAETAVALRIHADGKRWLHTGDIGCVDEEGYLYFRQRHCRMIITAGYNVYPTQIEDVIYKCNGVALCCVIGEEDRALGQKIVAYVQPNSMDMNLDELRQRIMQLCKDNIAEYALPRDIVFREALPKTAMGKVNFKALMEEK
jgi:long-chain acyl-CoA synthetase